MYYFFHSPRIISKNFVPDDILGINSVRNFAICAIFNFHQIFIYENKNNTLIAYYQRSQESLLIYGNSLNLEWNSDASLIVIGTDKGFLLIFSIKTAAKEININLEKEKAYSDEGFLNSPLSLVCEINLLDVIAFHDRISCVCLYRDDLLVAIDDGTLSRVKWDGSLLYNQEFKLTSISFFSDLEFSKACNLSKNEAICKKIEWFPSLSGVIILFQSGKSAFLHIPNHKLLNEQITGVWAENLRYATCFAVNVKFRSVVYGLKMGEAVIYKTDEETGAFRLQHNLKILCNEYPDADKITGAVISLKWSPDNFCLALCWENKGCSLWSVQGSLLFCSLGNKCGIEMNLLNLDWGCEGYSLWLIQKPVKNNKPRICIFQMAKSALAGNPNKDNHEHLLLLTSTHILIGPRKFLSSSEINLEYIPYPEIYISLNWPIKYVAIDFTGNRLAISGKYGFAFYFLISKRWRLFGNETQERTIEVSGGMVWYKHIVCLACFDNSEEKMEIRLYDSFKKIDNSLSFNYSVYSQILMMNIFDNILVVLSIDGSITLYEINIGKNFHNISIELIQIIPLENYIEFAACIVSFNLTSLHSDLGSNRETDELVRYQSLLVNYSGHLLLFQRDRSFLGARGIDRSLIPKENSFFKLSFRDSSAVKTNTITFNGPLVVAYNVEIMWTPLIYEECENKIFEFIDWNTKIYTMENSLWLNCGAHGLRVWLPLNGNTVTPDGRKKNNYSFLSKRIMLTFKICNFYPLVVLNNEALLMSLINEFSSDSMDVQSCEELSFANINKNRHIFLQHIIKELLRINLGIHALDLTFELKKLPYFNHSLELLLHEVLEEEATSKEPIPDPLLPRVVAFIQEFPNFLKTVVQCARKTELALWSYLFESAGNPKDLFENCLINNELDTAASYLIILQNTEHPIISQKQAILLLDTALYRSNWSLVENLIRFLKNIALNDIKITEKCNYKLTKEPSLSYNNRRRYRSGGCVGISGSRQYSTSKNKDLDFSKLSKCPINTSIDETSFSDYIFDAAGQKNNSTASPNSSSLENEICDEIVSSLCNQSTNKIQISSDENSESLKHNVEFCDILLFDSSKNSMFDKEIDVILTQFIHKKFQEYHLHSIMEFFINTKFTESQFVSWMIRERSNCYRIQNPIHAFLNLHNDFKWYLGSKLYNFQNLESCTIFEHNNSFQVLCNDGHNEIMELNKRKLRYLANILIKCDYYEWTFLVLMMLDEYDEILSTFQCLLSDSSQIQRLYEMTEFINTIKLWSIEEKTIYSSILFKIETSLMSLFEEKMDSINSQKQIVSSDHLPSINNKNKDDIFVLSPLTKHSSLNLGQLIIDTVNIKDAEEFEVLKHENINKSFDHIVDKSLFNGHHNLPKKNLIPVTKTEISEKLLNTYGFSENIQIFRTSDPLVSTDFEENKHTLGCFVS